MEPSLEPRRAAQPGTPKLAALWLAVAVAFGLLLAAAGVRGPLDDPDPARQRPGFLDGSGLPTPSPDVGGGIPSVGKRAVIFFARPQQIGPLCRSLETSGLAEKASLAVIVASPSTCSSPVVVTVDGGGLAARFGMPTPVDGGPPVGYALVDAAGRIRYRTLDPKVASGLREVATVLAAVR